MFSFTWLDIFSVFITKSPSAPKRVSTMKMQSITEKYEVITRLFWNFSKDDAIGSILAVKIYKEIVTVYIFKE